MANGEGCAEMMEALSIEDSSQRIESGTKLNFANEDMLDGQPPTTHDSQWSIATIEKGQKQNPVPRRKRRAARIVQPPIMSSLYRQYEEFHRRCCLLCGYRAPHRMLLQVHLSTCRKTSSWPALYSSRPVESEGTQVTGPVGLE